MAIQTIKDILTWTRELHQRISDTYAETAAELGDEQATALLNYVAEHEKNLAEAIAKFEEHSATAMMDNWFQEYMEKNPFMNNYMSLATLNPIDTAEIMRMTVEAHQSLINMYREFGQLATNDKLKDLFADLTKMDMTEMMDMMKPK